MKRTLIGAVAAAALAGGLVPAAMAASGGAKGPEPKVTFCHHTASKTNPYVVITTGNVALVRAHMDNHGDDVLASGGVCPAPGGGGGGDVPSF